MYCFSLYYFIAPFIVQPLKSIGTMIESEAEKSLSYEKPYTERHDNAVFTAEWIDTQL